MVISHLWVFKKLEYLILKSKNLMSNLTFQKKSLKVDFLSFNRSTYDQEIIDEIANYFLRTFHWSSKLVDRGKTPSMTSLDQKPSKRYPIKLIINESNYWHGLSIRMEGQYASFFYQKIQSSKFNWKRCPLVMDQSITLGRIDLTFDRRITRHDPDFHEFLKIAKSKISKRKRKRHFETGKDETGCLIGKRESPYSWRVYLKNSNVIRFELEIKKNSVKQYQNFFFNQQFLKFEEFLTIDFYNETMKIFSAMDSPFLDWSIQNFRHVLPRNNHDNMMETLQTSYLLQEPLDNLYQEEFLYRFLQLLNFLSTLESERQVLGLTEFDKRYYRSVQFPLNQFLEYIGGKRTNRYQLKQLVTFFKRLKNMNTICEQFSDGGFRGYVICPKVDVLSPKETGRRSWTAFVSVVEEFFDYTYPFRFPTQFLTYSDRNDLKIKLLFLKSFSNPWMEKQLLTEEFLNTNSLSNSQRARIKRDIVEHFNVLVELNYIEAKFRIQYSPLQKIKGKSIHEETTNKLTTLKVGRSIAIFYREKY
jgi:hypothetical protein